MKQLNPYLIFPGNCKEALAFYKDCLDGEIVFIQTAGESPMDVPEAHQDRVFNSAFKAEDIFLMASDDMPGNEVTIGSNISLFVKISDRAEQEKIFTKLSEGGNVLFPLDGPFGMLVDKYGISWMLANE